MQEHPNEESYEDKQRREDFLRKLKEIILRHDDQQTANILNEAAGG